MLRGFGTRVVVVGINNDPKNRCDVMLSVWKHPDFKGCMAEAVEKIERHHLKYFFVYCNQGTHRSVAMACLLNCLCYYNANVVVTTHRTRKDAFSIGWEEV